MNSPSTLAKLATGVPGFDAISHGGIPEHKATLITGKSGVGKTILSLQVACNLAAQGKRVLYITAEEDPEDIFATGTGLGLGLEELAQQGSFQITNLTAPTEGPILVSGTYDFSALIHRVHQEVRSKGIEVVVLDSANALFVQKETEETLRSHFFQFVHGMKKLGLTTLISTEAPSDYGPPLTKLGVEDFVCDMVIILRNVIDGEKRRRSIEIHKYRRSPHFKGQYPCTMTPRGLTIFPLEVRDPQIHSNERFSSGIRGLDELNHGGWLRDSIVLVRGPSGSGKTILAGTFARAGAMRGEKVVFYGFEESKPQLMRNFGSLGITLEELERQGTIEVVCQYPEATSPEDILVDLSSTLALYKPSLIVLDSISSIEHATSAVGFRQFMVGIASILRQQGRSALLTQAISSYKDSDYAVPYLSTIADVMLDLDYTRHQGSIHRGIRVIKMRGSAHSTEERGFAISEGGLRVEHSRSGRARSAAKKK